MTNDIKKMMAKLGQDAKAAYWELATASTDAKNLALREGAKAIRASVAKILTANAKDYAIAEQAGKNAAYLDRLALDEGRIEGMAVGLEAVADLADPVGKKLTSWERPNGLKISRISVPLGVIGVIFEARPNVTADAGALALKAGNAVILRCGSDSFNSSTAISDCLQEGLKVAKLPAAAVQLVPTQSRDAVSEMLTMTDYIDVIIPRGGRSLTEKIKMESQIPTFLHLDGNCHTYIHEDAVVQMAADVIRNAKMRRTGICGATESLVIDEAALDTLPAIVDALEGVEVRGDAAACATDSRIAPATDADWGTEYLDSIISVKTVANIDEAIIHINQFSSHHTDAIITSDETAAAKFTARVDSAIVMHNASTQFADGGEFGMGAEIGISTGRMHARGPVGVEQLTTYKYVVEGTGQVRA